MSGGNTWPKASRDNPCPNCGHKRRCHLRQDGGAVRCYWPEAGQRWGHLQENGEDANGAYEVRYADAPARPNGTSTPSEEEASKTPIATAAQLHQVYSDLLERCPRTTEHTSHLKGDRGFTDEQISTGRFGSLPGRIQWPKIIEALESKHGRELLGLIPGVRVGKSGQLELVAAGSGILIPYLRGGLIVGLRLRLDRPGNGGRYRWFSGGGGPSLPPSVGLLRN